MAQETAYYLSQETVSSLQDFIAKVNQWLSNTNNRPNRVDDDHQAPEVYLAKIPISGIRGVGASGTGSGSGSSVDVTNKPGSAECDIYRLVYTTDPTDSTEKWLIESAGFSKLVFNCGLGTLIGGTWSAVVRDKFGSWLAVTSGDGSTPIDLGDEIRMVRPYATVGPLTEDGTGLSGTGSGPNDDTYVWDAYIVAVNPGPPGAGFITNVEGIYLIQKTVTGPEPSRLLLLGNVYLGDFVGVYNYNGDFEHPDFRRVYAVVGAPGIPISHEETVVKSIDSVTATCNGGTPPTLTVTVNYTEVTIRVLD